MKLGVFLITLGAVLLVPQLFMAVPNPMFVALGVFVFIAGVFRREEDRACQ